MEFCVLFPISQWKVYFGAFPISSKNNFQSCCRGMLDGYMWYFRYYYTICNRSL